MENNKYSIIIDYYCDENEVNDSLVMDRLPEVLNTLEYEVYKLIGEGSFEIRQVISPNGSVLINRVFHNTVNKPKTNSITVGPNNNE